MTIEELREKFYSFLLRRPCTSKQAREFLLRQKISGDIMNLLINDANNTGLIDDLGYAKLFVDGHLTWGNAKISHELSVRGVSRENINVALDEAEDEILRATEIARGLRNSCVDVRKITARLLSRGFTTRAVRAALSDDM